ncbi:hypothetical protein [Marinobacterium lutimaris]|uniref:Uncharacterized protein n=1 Tax=Marinobacterium lutimaris TaxID=568106 RepID=A0A1H5XU42_9GAMM|nr:hypothetical protein [Marinobacterium lutimaris]SEG15198.1 hypothetical protein SAMN05444390_1011504 [Marinobacterium lutimaris]
MRLRIYLLAAVLGAVGLMGWLLLDRYQQNGQLQQQLTQTEQALLNTSSAMQELNRLYQQADQALVINRRQQQNINSRLRGEVDALRSTLSGDVRASACIPDATADRLRSITGSSTAGGLYSDPGSINRADPDTRAACYTYAGVVEYVPMLVSAIQSCNVDKASIRMISDEHRPGQ